LERSIHVKLAYRSDVWRAQNGLDARGPAVGQLELEPHGLVHVDVGGDDGLMSQFETAAQDPIFWLHHANIDRLWEVWRSLGHSNPGDRAWLREPFVFGSGDWRTALTSEQVTDTTAAPLRYSYEGVGVPVAAAGPPPGPDEELEPPRPARETVESPTNDEPKPELVGASDSPVPLGDSPSVVHVPATEPTGPTALRAPGPSGAGLGARRVYLTLENVTGTGLGSGVYVVYVNVPEDQPASSFPERRAGQLSTFGVRETSQADDRHAGSGLTFSFDITDIARRLEQSGDWDPGLLRVTVTPADPERAPTGGGVQIGRVGLYYA
jgi:tyrosinase